MWYPWYQISSGGTSMEHVTEVMGNSKHQARLPTYHFEKLLEESCPNHAYFIKHKLRDYNLMKSFMAIGSLPRGTEVVEAPIEDDVTPFPREDPVMMVFRRSAPPKKHTRWTQAKEPHPMVTKDGETKKCMDANFCLYINVYKKNTCVHSCIYVHIHRVHTERK
jgi:hypothetical protein